MRIRNVEFNQEKASENLSLILNPEETQEEKNEKIRKEMSEFLEGLK